MRLCHVPGLALIVTKLHLAFDFPIAVPVAVEDSSGQVLGFVGCAMRSTHVHELVTPVALNYDLQWLYLNQGTATVYEISKDATVRSFLAAEASRDLINLEPLKRLHAIKSILSIYGLDLATLSGSNNVGDKDRESLLNKLSVILQAAKRG